MAVALLSALRHPLRTRSAAARYAESIKANLVGAFSPNGITPLPHKRPAASPLKIYHFSPVFIPEGNSGWREYDTANISRCIESIANNQMVVSEAPVKLQIGVTTCAAITLYDRARKVGAAMHIHAMEEDVFKGFISLAMYKMGALEGGRLARLEARVLGIELDSAKRPQQIRWARDIRAFLKDHSVRLLPGEIGRRMVVKFSLTDGSLSY